MMETMRYFFYKKRAFLYLGLALGLSVLFWSVTQKKEAMQLFFLFFTQIWFLRLSDDLSDYEKDLAMGKMQLQKEKLTALLLIFALGFMGLNLFFFKIAGLIGMGLLLLIQLKERASIFAPLIAPISGIYYMGNLMSLIEMGWKEVLFLFALFLISVGFGIRKRKKDDL